jgi:hypothetical protein
VYLVRRGWDLGSLRVDSQFQLSAEVSGSRNDVISRV